MHPKGRDRRPNADIRASSLFLSAVPASSLFRPRRLALCERRGFFVSCRNRPARFLTIHPYQVMSTPPSPWTLDQDRANLQLPGLRAQVSLRRPELGVELLELGHRQVTTTRLLGVQLAAVEKRPLEESYVRGDDLVATFRAVEDDPIRRQIYWRAVTHGVDADGSADEHPGLDLILSAQTDLLDGSPLLSVVSHLVDGELLRLDPHGDWRPLSAEKLPGSDLQAWLLRPRESAFSYVQAACPGDVAEVEFRPDRTGDRVTCESRMFSGRLEKGVIRRGRMRGLLVPREDDQQRAVAAVAALLCAKLPLSV